MALPRKVVLIMLTLVGITIVILFGYYIISSGTGSGSAFQGVTNWTQSFSFGW